MVGTAIADHTQGNVAQGFCGYRFKTGVFAAEVAHHTDDAHLMIHLNGTDFLEAFNDGCQTAGLVDGDADTHFGSGNHVDGGLVLVKDAKNLAQEAKNTATTASESFMTFESEAAYNSAWNAGSIKSTTVCVIMGA